MDFYKEILVKRNGVLDDCINRIKQHNEIVLYGAGISGTIICEWMKENSIVPSVFIDSNPSKTGKYINGIKICPKPLLLEKFRNALIIVSCGDYAIISNELKKDGFNENNIMYIDPKWIKQPDGLREFIYDNNSKLQEAFGLLEDELSQKVFLNMLKYKMSYNTDYIKEIYSDYRERYFDKQLIRCNEIRNYVDVGGYNGDTIDLFVEKLGGGVYRHICL